MFFRILKKDLKRKKSMNIILLIFIILATTFLASSVNNLIAISESVDYFMEKTLLNIPKAYMNNQIKYAFLYMLFFTF